MAVESTFHVHDRRFPTCYCNWLWLWQIETDPLSFPARSRNFRTYLQAKVVTEFAFNGTDTSIFAKRSSMVLAEPGVVTTSTFEPSGFSTETCPKSANVLRESKRRAPRRM